MNRCRLMEVIHMSKSARTCLILAILLMVIFSSGAAARGANEKWAKIAATTSHNIILQPNPESKVNSAFGNVNVAKPTVAIPYKLSGRYFYRESFSGKTQAENPSLTIGGQLGTKWPTTLFNRDIGKGRELSRVFK